MACVALQSAYNELAIQRIKYVGKLSQQAETSTPPTEVRPPLGTRILATLGVKTISDEELLDRLRREREKHLEKIQELQREIEENRERNAEK